MKTIRNSVFETNSSSSHSISVRRNKSGHYDYKLNLNKSGFCILTFGCFHDFGWGPDKYNDLESKLNYLACLAVETYNRNMRERKRKPITTPEEILNIPDMKKLYKLVKENVKDFRGFKVLNDFLYYVNYEGVEIPYYEPARSIDHQSWEDYKDLNDWAKVNKITLENFLFNPYVELFISNDNG